MHSLVVYVKEGLPFAWDFSLENSEDSNLSFWLALFNLVSFFFLLYGLASSYLYTIFDAILSNKVEVLSTNPSATVFAFEEFNIHHKD